MKIVYMGADRVALFRRRALEAETKAADARSDEGRRAWLIVARDWTRMAEREAEASSKAGDPQIEQLIAGTVSKPPRGE